MRTAMTTRHYVLRCVACGRTFEDDGFMLSCPDRHEPAFLVTDYQERCFRPDEGGEGVFRYRHWLPSTRLLGGAGSSATYRSESLNRIVGLHDVWVVFNGYWPD